MSGPAPQEDRPRRHRRRRQLRQLRSCRASSSTATPTRPSASPASCTSSSAATTSATSSSSPRSTSTPPRSASTSARRSSPSQQQHDQVRRVARARRARCSAARRFDGLGEFYRQVVEESPAEPVDVAQVLRDAEADVLVSYLPVGSEDAQKHYAQACLDAGVAFVNAIPVFIACDPEWAQKFTDAGVPIVGDDIKSQVGATIVHRILARLFEDRGTRDRPHVPAELRREHGLQEHARARAARVQEDLEDAVGHQPDRPGHRRPTTCTSARPTTCRGSTTASGPTSASRAATSATCRSTSSSSSRCWDSPNSAGVIIDAVRCAKLALDRGIGGPLLGPVGVLHEVAAGAVPRRRGPPHGRGVRATSAETSALACADGSSRRTRRVRLLGTVAGQARARARLRHG